VSATIQRLGLTAQELLDAGATGESTNGANRNEGEEPKP